MNVEFCKKLPASLRLVLTPKIPTDSLAEIQKVAISSCLTLKQMDNSVIESAMAMDVDTSSSHSANTSVAGNGNGSG